MPGIYVIMELRLFRLLVVNIDNFDLPNAVGKIKCLRNVTKSGKEDTDGSTLSHHSTPTYREMLFN